MIVDGYNPLNLEINGLNVKLVVPEFQSRMVFPDYIEGDVISIREVEMYLSNVAIKHKGNWLVIPLQTMPNVGYSSDPLEYMKSWYEKYKKFRASELVEHLKSRVETLESIIRNHEENILIVEPLASFIKSKDYWDRLAKTKTKVFSGEKELNYYQKYRESMHLRKWYGKRTEISEDHYSKKKCKYSKYPRLFKLEPHVPTLREFHQDGISTIEEIYITRFLKSATSFKDGEVKFPKNSSEFKSQRSHRKNSAVKNYRQLKEGRRILLEIDFIKVGE